MGNRQNQLQKSTTGTESGFDHVRHITKHPTLKFVNSEKRHELKKLKGQLEEKEFHHELTLAFWFAIHLEDLRIAQMLLEDHYLIKQLIVCAKESSRTASERNANTDSMYSQSMSRINRGTIHGPDSYKAKAKSVVMRGPGGGLDVDDTPGKKMQIPKMAIEHAQSMRKDQKSSPHNSNDEFPSIDQDDEDDDEDEEDSESGEEIEGNDSDEESGDEESSEQKSSSNNRGSSSNNQSSSQGPQNKRVTKGKVKEVNSDSRSSDMQNEGGEKEGKGKKKQQKDQSSDGNSSGLDSESDPSEHQPLPKSKAKPKQDPKKPAIKNEEESDSENEEEEKKQEDDDSSSSEDEEDDDEDDDDIEDDNTDDNVGMSDDEESSSNATKQKEVSMGIANPREAEESKVSGQSQRKLKPITSGLKSSASENSESIRSVTQNRKRQSSQSSITHTNKESASGQEADEESDGDDSNDQTKNKDIDVKDEDSSDQSDDEDSSSNQQSSNLDILNMGETPGYDLKSNTKANAQLKQKSPHPVKTSGPKKSDDNEFKEVDDMSRYEGLSLGQVIALAKKDKADLESRKQKSFQIEDFVNKRKFDEMGITPEMIEATKLEDRDMLMRVKYSFRTKFENVLTNILKIALSKDEERVACMITAYYEINLDEEMLITALATEQYEWLKFVFGFQKNFLGSRQSDKLIHVGYQHLFDLIKKQHQYNHPEQIELKIRKILDWKILSDDNILQALLYHHYNEIAIEYMGYYSHLLDESLFIFSLTNGNNEFLRRCLLQNAFDKMLFRKEVVITQMIQILSEGYRINFILNVLKLIEISVWKNKHLQEIIACIKGFLDYKYDNNRLLLSSNPILSIALSAEILDIIAIARRKYENECFKIKEMLMTLGKMYSSKIDDQKYFDNLIMNTDFRGRSVLKIITVNGFEPLMNQGDAKAENMMMSIWYGKESHKCDGNIYGYSCLAHIVKTKTKKAIGKKYSFFKVVSNYFQPNFEVDYSFQYRYRTKSISFLFYQEFFCAIALLAVFQYVNYQYLTLFSDVVIKNTTNDTTDYLSDIVAAQSGAFSIATQMQNVEDSKKTYATYTWITLLLSCSLLFQFMLKLLFNSCSKVKITMDKWTWVDTCNGLLNIVATYLIANIDPESYINPKHKDYIDYYMIVVLCISWVRFFSYFLVVKNISKLILTLLAMVSDTLSFLFIVCCFILIMASVFTTLYQDTNPTKYGGLLATVQTLFNDAMGVFDYTGMEGREVSHSLLTIFTVFFANILLMNYLIAILSTTYENMRESGIFRYKCNLYSFCERYMIAFTSPDYGGFVTYPPPISYITMLLIPFTLCNAPLIQMQRCFSFVRYWIENVFIVIAFFVFEIIIMPIAYIKIWVNLIKNSQTLFKTLVNLLVFAVIGGPLMILAVAKDVYYMLLILCYYYGCRYGKVDELAEDEVDNSLRIELYNETRATVISLYKNLKKYLKAKAKDELDDDDDDNDEEDNDLAEIENGMNDLAQDPDFFHIDVEDFNDFSDQTYQIKKSIIIEEWKKRKNLIERAERRRLMKVEKNGGADVNSMLASSLRKMNKMKSEISSPAFKAKKTMNDTITKPQNKNKDLNSRMKIIFLEALKKGAQEDNKVAEEDDVDMSDFEIPKWHIDIIETFLTKFTLGTENSQNEHVDVQIMLKAMPNKVLEGTLGQVDLFNFKIIQESIIAFQNLNIVNAFEYFDDKNKDRVELVKENMNDQKSQLSDVRKILELVKAKIERNQNFSKSVQPKSPMLKKATTLLNKKTTAKLLDIDGVTRSGEMMPMLNLLHKNTDNKEHTLK